MDQGRPYRVFVEGEADRYGLDAAQAGNRAGPGPAEPRRESMTPMRREIIDRMYGKSHYAVAGAAHHGLKDYPGDPDLSPETEISADDEALKRLVEDARWVSGHSPPEPGRRPDFPAVPALNPATGGHVIGVIGVIPTSILDALEEELMEQGED